MSFVFLALSILGSTYAARSQTTQPDVRAKLVSMPEADYPMIAKDARVGGPVNVKVDVDDHGRVTIAVFASGPGPVCPSIATPAVTALRDAAVATASRATFSPAMTGSTPVPSVNVVTVEFKLEGSPTKNTATADGAAVDNRPATPRTISGGVLNGKATSMPIPDFPAAAKAVNASGAVGVQVVIAEDGAIYSAQAVSGHPLLRSASVKAACSSTFTPTLLQGQPVKVTGIIMYNFNP